MITTKVFALKYSVFKQERKCANSKLWNKLDYNEHHVKDTKIQVVWIQVVWIQVGLGAVPFVD